MKGIMKGTITAALILLMFFLTRPAAQADPYTEIQKQIQELQEKLEKLEAGQQVRDNDFRVYWSNGLRFKTHDEKVEMRIGGRIHNDWTWIDADSDIKDAFGNTQDGVQFRRARLYIRGDAHDIMHFRLQFDFAGGDASFKDVYASFTKILPFKLTIGQFKEPFSLEELTSSNNITFMERALPNAFSPSRNVGAMVSNSAFDQRMTWAAGVFRETDDRGRGVDASGYNVTGRITGTPIYKNGGADLVHLGVGYTYKNPQDDEFRIRQRPEAHLSDRFVDTGTFNAESISILGLEAALVRGPFSVQGEYMFASVDGIRGQRDVDFDGWYVQGSYWLTGENRKYSRSSGAFDFVNPKNNLSPNGGWGAWELAARYSSIELNDRNIEGGELDDITVGLNWHLNPNSRVMWNYVNADRKRIGEADFFMMRLQVHF